MSDTIAASSPPKKRRRWLRWLAGSTVVLLVLLVAVYFILTSSAFLKAVILPRVGGALNATVTVSDASIHPFSGIVLDDLKVQPNGQPPLVTASEIRVSYHLLDLLRGNLHVDEIALVSPTVALVQNPDGSSNLGTLLKALQAKQPSAATKPAPPTAATKPLQIDLGKLTLSNATFFQIKNYANGRSDFAGLTNVNVTLTNLKNGQTAKLDLSADVQIENNSDTNASDRLAASLNGSFSCALNADLKPGAVSGGVKVAVTQAGGAFSDFASFSAGLDCDVTPTEINQLALHFEQAGAPLGGLTVTGPFHAEKMEGRLAVALRGIDRRLLNLAGEKSGLDFGTTQIDCTNEIELANSGANITATGRFIADQVQVTRAGQTTPKLDFSVAYDVAVDRTAQSATLRSLHFSGTENGAPLLSAQLAGPMTAGFDGGGASRLGDAVLDVAVTHLNLADWMPFLGNLSNLAGATNAIDFGATEINSTNEIHLAKAGAAITAVGKFNVDKLQLTRAGQTTPSLDLSAVYDVTVDRAAQSATLRSLNLAGTQNGAPLLNAQLTSPMSVAWGGAATGLGDAALDLAVTGLNLADWQPFLGNVATAGLVGVKLKVSSHQGGKQIGFDLNTDVANLAARVGSNQISSAEITLAAHGQAAEFKQIALSDYTLQVALQKQPALTATGSANYDLATGDADAQVRLSAALVPLLQALPQPGMSVSSGDVTLNARVTRKQKTQTLAGDLTLTNFNGQIGKNTFAGYSSVIQLDVANSPEQIQIHQVAGSFSRDGSSGGDFTLSGTYQTAQKSAAMNVKLSGVNENALRPFLEPVLAGKKLVSVAVNGTVSGQYDPSAGSAVKANVQVANLVVNDPAKKFPATPLAIGLLVDASLNQQTADVRQLEISLTPTALATNQLDFSGRVDFSRTNAIRGNVKLAADSLDLTSYYDLFTGGTNAAASTAASAPAAANAGQEPPAIQLPFQNFTVAADIGRLFLHEVAISNFVTTVKIDGGHVVLNPFQLVLNGAPVKATADLELGVPGYQYNVAFSAQSVPLAPLVDTFEPERAGQMSGTLTSAAQISGAGVTGASLKKNLAGTIHLGLTNLNLSVINVHSLLLKAVINVVATIPELLSNPASAIASLFGSVTGHGGLMNQLQQSPIQVIAVQVKAGSGQVNLQTAIVQSAAFEADATGGITLNAVLTNSTINIPVTVLLSQAIAIQLNVTSSTASANAAYVPLPQFLTMSGTLGDPKANIDKLALAGVVVHSVGGSLLNPTGTNASPVGNLLNEFLRLRK